MTTLVAEANVDGPIAVREADLPDLDYGSRLRDNIYTKHRMAWDEDRGIQVKLGSVRMRPPFLSPRHRHTFAQFRYFLSGQVSYSKGEVYRPGDFLFLPEAVHYGPMQAPPDSTEECHFLDIQYRGASGAPYANPDLYSAAYDELAKTGTFEKGIYRPHEGRPMDSTEAVFHHLVGEAMVYPQPRVQKYFAIHTPALPWSRYADGIQVKHVGFFFETGPNVKLVKLAAGSSLSGGRSHCQQARFVIDGSIRWSGESYDGLSMLYYPPGDAYPETTTQVGATMLIAQWVNSGEQPPPFCQL